MPPSVEKVMFEIYRDPTYGGRYRVVYFTELEDHNKEQEFNRALRGDHFFDGYLRAYGKHEAKELINGFLERLNNGERVPQAEVATALKPYLA
jgi:hypothetical protein